MSDIAERTATAGLISAGKPKPGPKGKVLEPFAWEVLLRARGGQSMQGIANWLAEPPRNIAITRQAVHLWVRARIRKLVKLNAAFMNTGVCGLFQGSGVPLAVQPPEARGLHPPSHQLLPLSPKAKSSTESKPRLTDVSQFKVDASDLHHAQNPFSSDT